MIKQQAAALAEANSKQEELTKQLGEVQQKVATISGTDAKTGCSRRPISSSNSPGVSCGAIRT